MIMRKLTFILLIVAIASDLAAQKAISEMYSGSTVADLYIECQWANVIVRNWDQSTIKVEGTAMINYGENDDVFVYQFRQNGDRLYFESDIENMDDLPRFVSYTKQGQEYHYRVEKGEEDHWKKITKDHEGEAVSHMNIGVKVDVDLIFYVPASVGLQTDLTYGDLRIENCRNAMDVKNTYGHVVATFDSDILSRDCSLTSTYSFVDVTISPEMKADISLHTNYGEIYTDLDFSFDKGRSIQKMYHSKYVGALNNGGKELLLKATYNNIYVRQKS